MPEPEKFFLFQRKGLWIVWSLALFSWMVFLWVDHHSHSLEVEVMSQILEPVSPEVFDSLTAESANVNEVFSQRNHRSKEKKEKRNTGKADKEPANSNKTSVDFTKAQNNQKTEYNINLALPVDLQKVYGIGPVLSERVIKYRNVLGGFASEKQLYEVYGLDSTTVEQLLISYFVAGPVKTILVNSCSYQELVSHPYIDHAEAKAILGFVKAVRPFSSLSEIEDLNEVSSIKFRKIVPYLAIE